MKTILKAMIIATGCWITYANAMPNKETKALLAKAEKLAKDGNHREAVDLVKPLLADKEADGDALSEALLIAVSGTNNLGETAETETVIEDAAKLHADKWRVLQTAGMAMMAIPHDGMMVDGKFQRGTRHRGTWASSEERDHVRTLQLLMAARAHMPADAEPGQRGELFYQLFDAWSYSSEAPWKLQVLTDLQTLPEAGQESSNYSDSSPGYPVDGEGRPVFFGIPSSYETAANDGERLRFALQEWGSLSPANAVVAKHELALLAKKWFGVQTVSNQIPNQETDEATSQRNSIAALHTLAEDETVARLATGPRRIKLPAEYAFIPRQLEVAQAAPKPGDMMGRQTSDVDVRAFSEVIGELIGRRQLDRAVEVLHQAIKQVASKDARNGFIAQLDQITGNMGRFENREAQPEGVKAKLPLVFRNATSISLTARPVNVMKLLEDAKGYLKSKPKEMDWKKSNVQYIGQRLADKGGDKYLGKTAAEWKQGLQPAPHHWDKHAEIETPLTKAGAWWVEARFEGGHVARALVWIEGLTLVETKLDKSSHYFVCDAVTGAPVAAAKVNFFGYKQEWKDSGIFSKRPGYEISTQEFQAVTDANGVVQLDRSRRPEGAPWQWMVTATDEAGRLAFSGFDHFYYRGSPSDEQASARIYVITDRPVYRPGQEVKWKLWARKVGYDPKLNTNAFADSPCKITITNQRGEKVLEKTYQTDDSGAVGDTLKLADDATLGSYQVTIALNTSGSPRGSHSFRVEEYKKPEFEVKVQAPEKPVALGDSFEFKIKADYYFGGAVKEAKVKYKVSRTPYTQHWFPSGRWDWLFGDGYNWRSVSYNWYPGYQNWSVCIPRWPWTNWQSEPPEVVAQGETAISADGTVEVKIDSALAKELHGNDDHRYEIEAEVTDNSRRTIFGKGSVLAARRAFETYEWLDRGWYQAGDTARASISARTLDGKAVSATGKLRVLKLSYDQDGTPHEKEAAVFDIKTTEDEATTQAIKWAEPGQYRLAVTLKDAAGHESQTSIFTLVNGENKTVPNLRFDDLELITAKDEYQPGDEVEVRIHTNRPSSTVALFVRAEKEVAPVWIHLDGKTASHRFKLSEADQPNLFVEAYTVSNARLHKVTRQIIVPPTKRIATVELTTSKPAYLPRDKASAKLVVKDQDGKPFVGQVVITAYDKALEYISGGSNQPDMRPFFWGWKHQFNSTATASLRPVQINLIKGGEVGMEILGDSEAGGTTFYEFGNRSSSLRTRSAPIRALAGGMMAEAKSAAPMAAAPAPAADAFAAPASPAEPQASPDAPVMIRSNLADSAVWIASAKTNEAGEADIDFAMPDNLTTWKLKSWVMGPNTQVGEAAVEIITRKDLMVRLQAPRFFVEKDEVVISANVHNELDKEQSVEALIEVEGSNGASLTAVDGGKLAGLHQNIAAHAEHRFDWRLKVSGADKVVVRAKALAQGDSDAMEMTFPVYEHGTLKTDSWSLGLKPDQTQGSLSFTVPADRRPEMTRLEVRYSPTLAMALVDALPYLSGYPYGCTEQTLSRFVPSVVTLGVLKDLGLDLKQVREKRVNLNAQEIGDAKKRGQRWQGKDEHGKLKEAVFDEDEVMKRARAGLQRLEAMRNGDGGWGWFPGGRESSAHMTALVAHGLLTARATGLKINAGLIDSATQWLQRHEAEEVRKMHLPEKHQDHKSLPDDTDALVHSVLAQAGMAGDDMHSSLYKHRGDLSHYNLALFGLACDAMKRKDERDMCLRNLRQFLKQDDENQTAWLDLPGNGWWYWYDDPIETQAAFLRLLVAVEPKSEVAPRLAKYLLNNRRNGTYWNSTRDTATVIESLAAYMKASGETKPDVELEVLLDGVSQKKVSINRDNLFSFDGSLVLEGDALTTGKHTVEFRKQGGSPLYANAYLTLFSKEDMIPAAGLEIKVERRFYKLTEQKQSTNVSGSHGQVIAQQGVKYTRTELASGDALKSGDLVEVELSIESKNDYEYILIADPKPAGFEPVEVQSGWTYQGISAYREFRDEKVAFFAERLPKGRCNVSYRVKAEIPGHFSALPTKAEAMYAPELRGNAAEWKAKIED